MARRYLHDEVQTQQAFLSCKECSNSKFGSFTCLEELLVEILCLQSSLYRAYPEYNERLGIDYRAHTTKTAALCRTLSTTARFKTHIKIKYLRESHPQSIENRSIASSILVVSCFITPRSMAAVRVAALRRV